MFSKSLFKQSCKANGMMWIVITVAVCFTLSCVMLISGNGNISVTKNAIQNTIIEGELTSSIQQRGLSYYDIGVQAMTYFDTCYTESLTEAFGELTASGMSADDAGQAASMTAYREACDAVQNRYYPQLLAEMNLDAGTAEADEIKGIIFYTLNPMQPEGGYLFDEYFAAHGETLTHYTDLLGGILEEGHPERREKYVMNHVAAFLAGNMVEDEQINKVVAQLADYRVSREQYREFGFADYRKVNEIAKSAIVSYRADWAYRLDNLKEGDDADAIREEVKQGISNSFLATLPTEVSDALDEIGHMDLYGTLIGTIFFKMAGLLLPIIYMIMTANALIAGQVDAGSMAYILSSSTKRRSVTFTQAVFLVGSLFVMFLLTAVTSVVCLGIVDVNTDMTWQKLLIINGGAFLVMFAMSGICFLSSCYFDRSKKAMALGGGLSMFFLVATMLGLFGSDIMPTILRMKDLNFFNYISLITLFDTSSILEGTHTYLWKFVILFVVGCVCYVAGSIKFRKKDLPL